MMMMPKAVILMVCIVLAALLNGGEAFVGIRSNLAIRSTISLKPKVMQASAPLLMRERPSLALASSQSATINKAAVKAISKLLSTCGIGVLAGQAKILDQTALSVLSKLIFNVFQPCLLFVNVAGTVASLGKSSTGSPAALWLLPLAAVLQIAIGYIVGKMVSMIYKDGPNSESARQLLACTAFGNSGPLPLVFTDGLFRSHANTALLPQSVAYISLFLLGWSPVFWIIGPAVLKESTSTGAADTPEEVAKKRKDLLSRIFSPPVVGSLFGMTVGAVPFLRKLFISSDGLLNPLFEAMRTLGAAYLPAVLLVLAGSLSSSPSPSPTQAAEPEKSTNLLFDILPIFLARFALMPMLGFATAAFAIKTSPWARDLFAKDPMLLMVLLLETCMPSAQNTTVILQLQGEKSAAGRLAKKLMMIYVLGVPAITYWLIRILQTTNLA